MKEVKKKNALKKMKFYRLKNKGGIFEIKFSSEK